MTGEWISDSLRSILLMDVFVHLISLCTTICLQWEPEVVAIAVMFLAGKLNNKSNNKASYEIANLCWWNVHVENVTIDILEDICHQILDLYSMPSNAENSKYSPSQLGQLNSTPLGTPGEHIAMVTSASTPSMMDTSESDDGKC